MRSVAQDPQRGASGKVLTKCAFDKFQNEVSQALAINLDLKTRQHANEKTLHRLVRSAEEFSASKEAVQARAAIYGKVDEPS